MRIATFLLILVVCATSAFAQYSSPVRDVENPARTPFWANAGGTFSLNFINKIIDLGPIPSNQRLVMEHVSLYCTMDADDNVSLATISVNKNTGGGGWTTWSVPIVVQKQGVTWNGLVQWVGSQVVNLYSDGGGSTIYANINHSKTTATPYCNVFVAGHTITVQ